MLATFKDHLACFTADRGEERHSGVLEDSAVGLAGLTRVLAVEERIKEIFLYDAAKKTKHPNETADLGGEVVELRE